MSVFWWQMMPAATYPASMVAELYSLLKGHAGEQVGAEMWYAKAKFTGGEAWVELHSTR